MLVAQIKQKTKQVERQKKFFVSFLGNDYIIYEGKKIHLVSNQMYLIYCFYIFFCLSACFFFVFQLDFFLFYLRQTLESAWMIGTCSPNSALHLRTPPASRRVFFAFMCWSTFSRSHFSTKDFPYFHVAV